MRKQEKLSRSSLRGSNTTGTGKNWHTLAGCIIFGIRGACPWHRDGNRPGFAETTPTGQVSARTILHKAADAYPVLRCFGEMQGKGAPDTRRALDGDVSSMNLHDLFCDGKRKPEPAELPGQAGPHLQAGKVRRSSFLHDRESRSRYRKQRYDGTGRRPQNDSQ